MPESIAVVIPTFNRAELIGRAIESVLAQRRQPDEVIVVDDGSTDHTQEVVEHYARHVTFEQKPNGGVSSARNVGVRRSATDFVAFLDSDDFWYEDHLERMERAITDTGGRAGLYFSDQELAPSRGSTAWRRADFSIEDDLTLSEDGRAWAFLTKQPMTINASVVSRDAYLGVGGCNERLVCREDTHLYLKLGLSVPLCAVRGYAGMLTAADGISLSSQHSAMGSTYVNCTVLLYSDILRTFGTRLTADDRRLLSRRLGTAHWTLARRSGSRSPFQALLHIGQAVIRDPSTVARALSRRARALPFPSSLRIF
jgi:glycosyltransferase involved in cell wall biosynthesis